MNEKKSTIFERMSKYPLQMQQLFEAKKSPLYAPLAELILASEQIAVQAREPWEFKSLAQMGSEEFISTVSLFNNERWLHYAEEHFAYCIVDFIYSEKSKGLLFFVQNESGKYRAARSGDASYDFVSRLHTEGCLLDLRFSKPPAWAEELFLGHENFDIYQSMWYNKKVLSSTQNEVSVKFQAATEKFKADTVIRETWQRMGSIPGLIKDADLADSAPEKPLLTTERNTLLLIIAALFEHSAIDYKARGASKIIEEITDEVVHVSNDAILKILEKIPNALNDRMK